MLALWREHATGALAWLALNHGAVDCRGVIADPCPSAAGDGDHDPRPHPANTIIGGVIELWQSGDAPIAIIVFVASFVIPVVKILTLLVLLWLAERRSETRTKQRLWLYKVTDWIGRWSMIDIFVVAVLVALVRSGQLMSVYPGNAALAFALTVILTMLAAMTFDTRQFFRTTDRNQEQQEAIETSRSAIKNLISPIWLIPLLALAMALWMVWQGKAPEPARRCRF